jgi:transposase InsO family protein
MPWLNTQPMDQKIAFISRALVTGRGQFSGLCRQFGIARKTGYKWLRRYRAAQSLIALQERSRRPQRSPHRISTCLEARILELRSPDGWGARKIAYLLWEQGVRISVATVHRTLLRHDAVHRLHQHTPALTRFERPTPNDLFQADFKGPMGRGGLRDEPLTLLDDHSRFALGVFALRDHSTLRVQDCFVRVFERYGLPRQLLLDHGTPWWNNQNGWGLARLSVFFIQQDIELVFGRVRHPQTQGKIERFHRTLARSMTRQGLPATWEQWQARYDGFVERYNQVRPHEALAMQRPVERYRPSARRYRAEVPPWLYPAGLTVCRVDASGMVRVAGHRYFVCEALVHQEVALEQVGQQILVRFRNMYFRELNLPAHTTLPFIYPVSEVTGHLLPMS